MLAQCMAPPKRRGQQKLTRDQVLASREQCCRTRSRKLKENKHVVGCSHPADSSEEVASTASSDSCAYGSDVDVLEAAVAEDFKKRNRAARGAGGGRATAAAGRGRGRGRGRSTGLRLPETVISQSQAKLFIPPGSSIWRGMTVRGVWSLFQILSFCFECPPVVGRADAKTKSQNVVQNQRYVLQH